MRLTFKVVDSFTQDGELRLRLTDHEGDTVDGVISLRLRDLSHHDQIRLGKLYTVEINPKEGA